MENQPAKSYKSTNRLLEIARSFVPTNQRSVYWLYFILVFVVFFIFFTYISIHRLGDPWTKDSIFLNFYLSQYAFIKGVKLYFLISVSAVIIILSFAYLKVLLKKSFSIKKYIICLFATLVVGFLSFSLSFVGSLTFSINELIYIEYNLYHNSLQNNLLWDPDLISQKLNDTVIIPEIIIASNNINDQIASSIINRKENRGSFYKKVTLRKALDLYPINFVIPNASSFVMFQDTLYIRNFNGDSFQTISPSLGKLLVRNTFGSRSGKEPPFIQVLAKEKYQSFRIHQINSKLRDLATLIEKLSVVIKDINSEMSRANDNISYYKRLASASYSQGDLAFLRCTIDELCNSTYIPGYCGVYFCSSGYTIRNCTPTFTYSYCSSLRDSYYEDGSKYTATANYWVGQYNYNLGWLNKFVDYRDKTKAAQAMTEIAKKSLPYELGLFVPDNNIKIAISSTESRKATEYISTITHEYLHYDSYGAQDKTLPKFFEEGLTEYLSRKAQKNGLGSDINLGYPLITAIIERLAEKIPEKDLEDIYYSKDPDLLKTVMDKNLGKDFFENNSYYFDIISFFPEKMALEMANSILEKLELQKIEIEELINISSLTRYN
jgi:hypothetical protein